MNTISSTIQEDETMLRNVLNDDDRCNYVLAPARSGILLPNLQEGFLNSIFLKFSETLIIPIKNGVCRVTRSL